MGGPFCRRVFRCTSKSLILRFELFGEVFVDLVVSCFRKMYIFYEVSYVFVSMYLHTGVFCCVVLFFLSHTATFSHPRPQKNMTSILAPLVSAGYLPPNRGGRGSASRRRGPYEGAGEHLRRRARGVPFRGGVRRFHLVGLHRPAQLVSCVWERDIPQGRPWMRIYRLKQGG